MEFVSHTASELRTLPCPEKFKEILPYYLIKYSGKKEPSSDGFVQLFLMDGDDILTEDE